MRADRERAGVGGRERRRFRRYSSHASPPSFFPASGYLLIGYSKISETRRYRRKKRGDAREDENDGGRGKEDAREAGKEGVEKERASERASERAGGRVVADRTRGWGLTTTTPQRRGFLFVPASSFLFLSPLPDPTHPTVRELRFLRSPLPPARPLILFHLFLLLHLPPPSSSSPCSYHRPPKIRVRYYLSPDRFRSATPANVLFHPVSPSAVPPSPVMAVRPLPVPAQFNCWHFIKSIDSAPSCLRLCKLMPRPTDRPRALPRFRFCRYWDVGWKRGGERERKRRKGGRVEKLDKKS